VTKLDDERYLVVASDTVHRHVETWLRRHLPGRGVTVTDVTSAFTLLSLQGPASRELLRSLTPADLTTEAFPFRTAREIELGLARLLCLRITYVGELGYELYVPTEHAADVHDRLVAAGARHVGLKALGSLRLEKGYRDYGHDVDNTDPVDDVGLGFAVRIGKPGGFLGREAVVSHRALSQQPRPVRQRLVHVLLRDPEPLLFHAEVVHRDGRPVGYVRAGSYGHTLGAGVGLAMVEAPDAEPVGSRYEQGRWQVDVAGRLVDADVSLTPFYDPLSERVRG
jgi:glycine cleavage system aminomethyltransferase T